jgi:two-component system, NarL family, response regulator NreC
MKKLRVFLVDDHSIVREGLKRILENDPGLEVIGEESSGAGAIREVPRLKPDVVVMDISMPEMNGPRACWALLQKMPSLAVLVLTVHEEKSYMQEVIQAGARGYVLKRTVSEELIGAIRTVAAGQIYIDPRVAEKFWHSGEASKLPGMGGGDLSKRELTVLRLIAQGYSNKEIGGKLGLSVKTIETYKVRSMEKLGLRSRVDVVRYALKCGWLEEPPE